MEEIQKGQKYETINKGDFHSGTALIVLSVTGQEDDKFVFFKAESPKKDNRIKGHKRYNQGSARVWWFREYCKEVKI